MISVDSLVVLLNQYSGSRFYLCATQLVPSGKRWTKKDLKADLTSMKSWNPSIKPSIIGVALHLAVFFTVWSYLANNQHRGITEVVAATGWLGVHIFMMAVTVLQPMSTD